MLFQDTELVKVADSLQQGNILAYPTESVWGLGCDPYNESAMMQLLSLKNRPVEKGVILVAGSLTQVHPYIEHLPAETQRMMKASWQVTTQESQQAVTWLVPLQYNQTPMQQHIPKWITGKHSSVAIRVTPHPLVQSVCHAFGSLLVSTSCNKATQAPANDLATAQAYFADKVNYLNGATLDYQKPSKIMNALTLEVLR